MSLWDNLSLLNVHISGYNKVKLHWNRILPPNHTKFNNIWFISGPFTPTKAFAKYPKKAFLNSFKNVRFSFFWRLFASNKLLMVEKSKNTIESTIRLFSPSKSSHAWKIPTMSLGHLGHNQSSFPFVLGALKLTLPLFFTFLPFVKALAKVDLINK